MDESSPDLPEEVIEVILSKSDVKSVVRSKSVSKSWQSIVSDPRFPGIHRIRRSQLPENQNKSLIWARPKKKPGYFIYLIKFEDGKFVTESVFPYQLREFGIPLCYCHGMILLGANVNKHSYLLWNPSIRETIIIRGLHRDTTDPYPSLHHFYYDSVTEDYKILFLYADSCYTVYSCKDRIWSETRVLPCDIGLFYRGEAVDGCFYAVYGFNEIVCFNAREGTAEKLRQPEGVNGLIEVTVGAISGRLCLYGLSSDRQRLQMWVIEKSGSFCSWRKVVAMEKAEGNLWMFRPLFFSNEGEVVMSGMVWEKKGLKYFIYNPRQKRFREMKLIDWEYPTRFYPYSENLYMPCSNMEVEM